MRRGRLTGLVWIAASWLGLVADAPVVRAASVPFTGSFAIQFRDLPPAVAEASGVAIVNGSGDAAAPLTRLALPASVFSTSMQVVPVTDPDHFPISGLQLTARNQSGELGGVGGSGSFGGVMPLAGSARLCLFGACEAAVSNLVVPLTVVGSDDSYVVIGAVSLTVAGAPWTTGTAVVGTLTRSGGVETTPDGARTVTLVTPILIASAIGALPLVPGFGVLTLHLVPEPGTLVLLASGIALLVAAGRAQR